MAILAWKDVQIEDDTPSRLGSVLLDMPMTDAGDLLSKAATSPGPRVSAVKILSGRKISRHIFLGGRIRALFSSRPSA